MPPSPFIPMAVILFHCVTTAQPPQPCSVDGSCNSAAGAFPDLPLQEYFWSICICCTVRPINVHLCKLQLLSSRRGPLGPHPSQHLYLVFFVIAILTSVRFYLVFICTYLMINEEHLFICLLSIYVSFSGKCLFKSSASF